MQNRKIWFIVSITIVFLLISSGIIYLFYIGFFSPKENGEKNLKPRITTIQLMEESSLAKATELVEQAGRNGSDLVLLPMGFGSLTPQTTTGIVFQTMSPLAAEYNMYVIVPIPELSTNEELYTTALIINSTGELAGIYRQTHLSSEDKLNGVSNGNEIPVFDTHFGKIGIMLGYDLLFPEVARILTLRGAELLLYSYDGDSSDEMLPDIRLKEAAFFNAFYVAMAGLVEPGGEWASNIFDFQSHQLTMASQGECLVSAEINLQIIVPHCGLGSREELFACRNPYAVSELTNTTSKTIPVIDQTHENLTIATIQCVNQTWEHIYQKVLPRAGQLGADVVLTQEVYIPNPENLPIEDADSITELNTIRSIANSYNMTIITGIGLGVEEYPEALQSSFVIINGDGNITGVHYQHTGPPADDFHLFDTSFDSFGGLVCWDLNMMGPEYARVETLMGAHILFFGTIAISNDTYDFVLPSLAKTNVIPIAYSAPAKDNLLFPQAGVIGANGTYLLGQIDDVELGKEIVLTTIDLNLTTELADLKQQLWDDRRPELYTPLIQSDICLPHYEVKMVPEEPSPGELVEITVVTYNAIFPWNTTYDVQFSVDGEKISTNKISYERWSCIEHVFWNFEYRFLNSTFSWTVTAGEHTITIDVNSDGVIAELREDNNQIVLQIKINGSETMTSTISFAIPEILVVIIVSNRKRRRKKALFMIKSINNK